MAIGAPSSLRPRLRGGFLARHLALVATLAFSGAIVAAWQFLPPAFSVPEYVLPTPAEIARASASSQGTLLNGLKSTAIGAFGGFVAGNLAGFAAAVAIASSVTSSRVIL